MICILIEILPNNLGTSQEYSNSAGAWLGTWGLNSSIFLY